jgi:hypothetical protein
MQRLREICDKHNLLLIFDEVITGFGRLGKYVNFRDIKVDRPRGIGRSEGLKMDAMVKKDSLAFQPFDRRPDLKCLMTWNVRMMAQGLRGGVLRRGARHDHLRQGTHQRHGASR